MSNSFRSLSMTSFLFFAFLLALPLASQGQSGAAAQTPRPVASRLVKPIDENSLVSLGHTVHPLASKENDRGAAADDMQLDRIQIVMKRSEAQEATLKQRISDLHTPGTASYHQWMTPEQFGEEFGPSDADLATIENWLQSHGFKNMTVKPGRQMLEFAGSVAQMRNTFHTQIRKYEVNGETHFANATDPQIPAALASVLGGFASLNNFPIKSHSKLLGKAEYNTGTHRANPSWTLNNGGSVFALSPADYAVQYDLQPLYNSGTNGSGQTIAIINESNINIGLVNSFRKLFGLSYNPPQVIIDGNDPGIDGANNPDGLNNASVEAYLDVEWAGAVAPGATIDLVIAGDTALQSGLLLAAERAVYGNVAPVMSLSFGYCEAGMGAENEFFNGLWEQAAAQGITVMVSTGDSGSASCDNDDTQEYAVRGEAVSGMASTPYDVAVGGTDFYYSSYNQGNDAIDTQLKSYWNFNPSNSQPAVSIKGVIPEQAWNGSQYGLNLSNYYEQYGQTIIAAGSGGASSLGLATTVNGQTTFGPYPKPSWQAGTGVPADHARDIPDVALFASSGSNFSFYPICYQDGDCQAVASGDLVQIYAVGGTSASSPSFAGIMALVNQRYGRQGQSDFVLYPLAKQFPAAFNDVVHGNNSVPCNTTTVTATTQSGSFAFPPTDCLPVSNPISVTDPTFGATTEGQIGTQDTPGFEAGPGYDLATGLGSVDANVLVKNWGSVKFGSSTTTLTPSSTNFSHGTPISISGSVTGNPTPTGSVALMTDSNEPAQQGQTVYELSDGAYTGTLNWLPGGTYNIWGQYSGDGVNAASSSTKTTITVTPEATTTGLTIFTPTSSGALPIVSGGTYAYGTTLVLSAQPAPGGDALTYTSPTGNMIFADGSTTLNTAVLNAEGDAEYSSSFAPGQHSITASYLGDKSYNSSLSSPQTFVISKETPTIVSGFTNVNSAGQVMGGEQSVLTVLVENTVATTGAPMAPSGAVTLTGAPAGTPSSAALSGAVNPSSGNLEGATSFTVPANITPGTYNMTLKYAGDKNYNPASYSFSAVFAPAAAGLHSTTTVSAPTTTTTPTTPVELTITVTGQSGHPAPTGSLIVYSSGYQVLNTVKLPQGQGGSVSVNAELGRQKMFQGSNQIIVQYSGDAIYLPSTGTLALSNPFGDFTMIPLNSVIEMPASGTAKDGINISSYGGFSGSVALSCTGTAGLSCSLSSPSATLATDGSAAITLTVNQSGAASGTSGNIVLTGTDSSGAYVHTLGLEVASAPAVTPGFSLSASAVAGITAGASGTSTISITPVGGLTGDVTLSCAVTSEPAAASAKPTCSVTNPPTITGTSAVTSILTIDTTATTTTGAYTFSVTGTSGNIRESTTVAVKIEAPPVTPSFTLSGSPISALTPGQSGSSTITVTPSGGFTGSVQLTCAITSTPAKASDLPTCSVTAPSAITGSSSVMATLTVHTTAATTAALATRNQGNLYLAGSAAATLLLLGLPARSRRWKALLGMVIFAALLGGVVGCGGGSPGTKPVNPGPPDGGTTAGNYSVTVTGSSGDLTQATVVNLSVN